MTIITNILPYIQIILSVILIVAILLQQSDAGIGGVLGGGGDAGGLYHTRRGFEKFIFIATIVIAILLVISSFAAVFLK
jgi:protein translocase SecG subunit